MKNFQDESSLFEWEQDDTEPTQNDFDNGQDTDEPPSNDSPENWDGMQDTLDQAGDYTVDNQQDGLFYDNIPASQYGIIRLLLSNGLSLYDIRNLFRRYRNRVNPTQQSLQPYVPITANQLGKGNGAFLIPQNGQRYLDLVLRTQNGNQTPEKQALLFLQKQRNENANILRRVKQVNMILPQKPCPNCVRNLQSGLSRVLPKDANVKIRFPISNTRRRPAYSTLRGRRPIREINEMEMGCACQHKNAEFNQEGLF
jgi:hypothetical protein